MAPRLGLLLGVRAEHAWPRKPLAPLVSEVSVTTTPILRQPLQGRVLGPERIPIGGAQIDLPGLGLTTTTASDGMFVFKSIPQGKFSPRKLGVRAKSGRRKEVDVDPTDPDLCIFLELEDFR